MTVYFSDLFSQAEKFLRKGSVNEAVAAYRDIAALATEAHEAKQHVEALLLCGTAMTSVINKNALSNYRDAVTVLADALQGAISLGDRVRQGRIFREMAVAADRAGDYANAATLFQKAVEHLESTEQSAELGLTYGYLAAHLAHLGQVDGSMSCFDRAFDLFSQEPHQGYYPALIRLEKAKVLFPSNLELARDLAEEADGWFEADHGEVEFVADNARTSGLLAKFTEDDIDQKAHKKWLNRYASLVKKVDSTVAQTIQSEITSLH